MTRTPHNLDRVPENRFVDTNKYVQQQVSLNSTHLTLLCSPTCLDKRMSVRVNFTSTNTAQSPADHALPPKATTKSEIP